MTDYLVKAQFDGLTVDAKYFIQRFAKCQDLVTVKKVTPISVYEIQFVVETTLPLHQLEIFIPFKATHIYPTSITEIKA